MHGEWKARARWVLAAFLALYSFFAGSDQSPFDFLTTSKGRLLVLLVALGVAFWPQLSAAVKDEWFKVRPTTRRQLKRQTRRLVSDLYAWEDEHPRVLDFVQSTARHQALVKKMNEAPDEETKTRIWSEGSAADYIESERAKAPMRLEFGGQVKHLLQEYERRGVLAGPRSDKSYLEWLFQTGNVAELAASFDALSRKL